MTVVKNLDTNLSHVAGIKLGTQQKISTFKIIALIIAAINQGIRGTIDLSRH